MAYPERYHIEALRKLRGDAYVTFPASDLTTPTVERVFSVLRGKVADPDAFNAPQTVEFTGTQLTEQHFVGGDAIYVEVYQKWETLPGSALVTQSVGLPESVIPEKYRRLIRTVETNQPVGPTYTFPAGLTGNQRFISLAQETISRLRLKIIEERINFDETPIQSSKTGEFGILTINEEIVEEGTPPLVGELIQSSDVEALGDGKAIRITVRYPSNLFSLQKVTRSLGQESLIPEKYRRLVRHVTTEKPVPVNYVFPSGLTGDQTFIEFAQRTITEARLRIIEEKINTDETPLIGGRTGEFGNLIILEEVVDEGTLPLSGQLIQHSEVNALGNGKAIRITLKYPSNLFDLSKVTRTIGTPETLIPVKYRRLIRTVETEKPVPVDYVFPSGLVGDQTFIEFAQKSITEARLRVHQEVINTDETPLQGAEGDQYGVLAIFEEVVDEGTPIQTGFLIKHSEVNALGNNKSIRITVTYTAAQVAGIEVLNAGTAGSNGSHSNGTFGTGGAFSYTVTAGAVVASSIVITDPGSNFRAPPTPLFPSAGSGFSAKSYLGTAPLVSRLYDEEMRVHYDESKQIVMVGIPDSPDADYVKEETRQLDIWRAERVRTKKVPTAVDEATAVVEYRSRPYAFPGLFPSFPALTVGSNQVYIPTGYRKTTATLTQARILTYWVLSSTAPVVTGDTIITDSIFVFTAEDVEVRLVTKRFEGVLHDALTTTYVAGIIAFSTTYPATTPSYSEYTGVSKTALTGTVALTNASTAVVGTGTLFLSEVSVGDFFDGIYPVSAIADNTHLTLATPAVGGGSGLPAFVVHSDPSSAWVGNEKSVSASVTATGHARLWKIQVEKIVMR